MTEEPGSQPRDEVEPTEPARPAPRNPFAEPDEDELGPERPALIKTRRSAALAGVIVGLVALLFVVLICVFAAIAFG